MSTNEGVITKYIEQKLDGDQIAIKELLTKLFIRIRVFAACVIIPPILALMLTALVPAYYEATAQVLIRYTGTESAFFGDLVTEGRASVSGTSSAQIMQSIPVLARTIQQKQVEDKDVYKDATKVLGGYVGAMVEYFLPDDEMSKPIISSMYDFDRPTLLLAGTWQEDGIEVETTQKSSGSVPLMNSGDELITVTIKAFNREKIAEMANGIAESFVVEYNQRSAKEAKQAYQYLDVLVKKAEHSLEALETRGTAAVSEMEAMATMDESFLVGNKRDRNLNSNPRLENTAKELASLETELAKRRQTFKEGSQEISQIKARIGEVKKVFSFEERVETAKDMLGDLKRHRQQAALTQHLYENNLVPISIVQPAFMPKKSPFKLAARYLIAGGAGLALGIVFGLGLIVTLTQMDRRIYSSWDIQNLVQAPVLGVLAHVREDLARSADLRNLPLQEWEGDIQRILGRIESLCPHNNIMTVTSSSDADANSFVTLQMACSLAKDRRNKILLIDGNLSQPRLGPWFAKDMAPGPGLLEILVQDLPLEQALRSTVLPNLFFIPAGDTALCRSLGFFRNSLQAVLAAAQEKGFNLVLIDSQSILMSQEALLFCMSTPTVVLNARAMVTKQEVASEALTRLAEVGCRPVGTILDNKLDILPASVYKLL